MINSCFQVDVAELAKQVATLKWQRKELQVCLQHEI